MLTKYIFRWISPDVPGRKLSAMELMITRVMLNLITAELTVGADRWVGPAL